jgi:anti-sigma factor RsiW
MTCEEADILLHALIDNELDAGHAREVEAHAATCAACAAKLRTYGEMRTALASANLHYAAPAGLRMRINATLPARTPRTVDRRVLLRGFAIGSAATAALAASGAFLFVQNGQETRLLGEIAAAHVRSLQADHLTDVASTNQHTVKPWFNGRLDLAPPVVDLTTQGFTLLGGRLDYIGGRPVAALVYRRRQHVINLFVAEGSAQNSRPRTEIAQGFNVLRWSERGLDLFAISDLNADELREFGDKFAAAEKASS